MQKIIPEEKVEKLLSATIVQKKYKDIGFGEEQEIGVSFEKIPEELQESLYNLHKELTEFLGDYTPAVKDDSNDYTSIIMSLSVIENLCERKGLDYFDVLGWDHYGRDRGTPMNTRIQLVNKSARILGLI